MQAAIAFQPFPNHPISSPYSYWYKHPSPPMAARMEKAFSDGDGQGGSSFSHPLRGITLPH